MNLRHSLFSLKSGIRARALARELCANQSLSSDQLEAINFQRRQALVKHCQINVQFYQRRFSELGINWQDIKNESDFAKLPILEKSDVRQFQRELISNTANRKKLRPSTTGGTTGEPLTVFSDPTVPLSTMTWRMLNMWGVDVSDNSGYLYRAVPRGLRKRLSDIALYPTRRAYLAAAEMNRGQMEQFYLNLQRIKPKYLVGYVGALDAFADFLQQTNRVIPSLKVVWTTAAPLPDLKRKYLREVYGCPVYTQYGCVETFMIAAESPEMNGLYIYSDIRHIEIVNGYETAQHGELGDVLVTDLTNYTFPFLRYRLGDQSRFLPNDRKTKLHFPRIDYVHGRNSDNIRLPDGKIFVGAFWTSYFNSYADYIKSFQILQKKDFSIEVAIELLNSNNQKIFTHIKKELKLKIGDQVPVFFVLRKINNNENGKTRFVKSELSL